MLKGTSVCPQLMQLFSGSGFLIIKLIKLEATPHRPLPSRLGRMHIPLVFLQCFVRAENSTAHSAGCCIGLFHFRSSSLVDV
jgi:hypothetical protein